jgi:CNT family concentrative nucleoside transporter
MSVSNVSPSGTLGQPTPFFWRLGIAGALAAVIAAAYLLSEAFGRLVAASWEDLGYPYADQSSRFAAQFRSGCGVLVFFGIVALFSSNLRRVNWRTIGWGITLQVGLAILVLKVSGSEKAFKWIEEVVTAFIGFSNKGADFVFGDLSNPEHGFKFAFVVLPPILFISAFFTVLYHFGILQFIVRVFARVMVYFLGTSGAETLSVSANVIMGQTEAPLIVKPYVPRMTNSELFTLMVSGFDHISGALMAVYITYGANPAAVFTTCVMACPGSLYLAKLFLPETGTPETAGTVHAHKEKSPYVNAIDAAATGTTDGLRLALNVAAMLIVFIAFVAMADFLLAKIKPALLDLGVSQNYIGGWPDDLSLRMVFGWIFSPVAFLMGVDTNDVENVGSLLGTKLALNEHVAYLQMKAWKAIPDFMTVRSYKLAAFALTGFANFASVGIQLGGIGAIAPERRHDLARLGGRALFVGFTATLLNAAIAGILID